jgi:glycosyltransferase involved in cell wall biosynthesis
VARRAHVLPLGVDLARFDPYRPRSAVRQWGDPAMGPLVLWNQRWEYDKDPAAFFSALYALQEQQVPFRVAVAGANQGLPTRVFVEARKRLEGRLVQWGRLGSFADYATLLWEADIVVSTALHEFFGTAVVEAVYCGCRPILPHRLSYPELMPEEIHHEVLYDEGRLVPLLLRALTEGRPWSGEWQRTWVSPYDWGQMAGRYDEMLWSCWERSGAMRSLG